MIEESKARRADRAPTHPGALLREDVLPATRLAIATIAKHLHVTRQQLHRVLSEESGISPEKALRLEKVLRERSEPVDSHGAYDLWEARRKPGGELDSIPTMERADL